MKHTLLLAAACVMLTSPALAHRPYLMPSATVLSGAEEWLTVDAAVSDNLFYFDHNPLQIDTLQIVQPDGSAGTAENIAKSKVRNIFDLALKKPGTYRIAVINDGVFANYKLNGETKRWRGKADEIGAAIPAGATDVSISENAGRVETFVTLGKPSDKVLKPKTRGLELVPITHPNTLVAGEPARFRFLLDGKPVANLMVVIVPGGIRYRDELNDMRPQTDKDGYFTVTWPQPGFYWLNASVQDDKASIKNAKRRATYTVTLEAAAP